MKVSANTVVKFEYAVSIDGEIVDRTPDGETQTILIGHAHGLPPKLERVLHGREAKETFRVRIEARDAYGEYQPAMLMRVPRTSFPDGLKLEPGSRFYSQDADGQPLSVRVISLETDSVVIDANPEGAGKSLEYHITIHAVRRAEPEEIEHGHVHGAGGVTHHR